MKIEGDHIVFSSGTRVYCFGAVVGMPWEGAADLTDLLYGYDGRLGEFYSGSTLKRGFDRAGRPYDSALARATRGGKYIKKYCTWLRILHLTQRNMVRPERFELPASWFVDWRPSYRIALIT